MLAIVVSRADSASEHIGDHLLAEADWTEHDDSSRSDADGGGTVYRAAGIELREFDDLHLELDDAGAAFGRVDDGADRTPDLLVFASRHAGETGALLTAHFTGNFGPAEFGGTEGGLARACPGAHKRVLDAMREHAPPDYDVGMECTHHGPSDVGVPSMFVELGSGQEQWTDAAGARAVAEGILELRGADPDLPSETAGAQAEDDGTAANETAGTANTGTRGHLVGFGGGHYAPRFERIVRETDWAVGHLAADWALDDMGDPQDNRDVVRRAFEASAATRAVVEGDAADVEAVVDDLGFRVVSETWVRETESVPLGLVESLEDTLCPVEAGLRFGDKATAVDDAADGVDFTTVVLPPALLAEAQGIDPETVRAAVEASTLAFETTENGTRAEGRAAVRAPADRDQLIDDLVTVLGEGYDSVERTDDAVIAREQAFDPDRARTLGVSEGPKFGRLSAGQPVEVDGETIPPETVHVEREHRFPIGDD